MSKAHDTFLSKTDRTYAAKLDHLVRPCSSMHAHMSSVYMWLMLQTLELEEKEKQLKMLEG